MSDLDAAIRERLDDLDNTRWNTLGQQLRVGDMFPEATAAVRAVLDACSRTIWILDANEVRTIIARELGVTEEADRGSGR